MNNPLTAMWSGRLGNKHYAILLLAFWLVGRLQSFVIPASIPLLHLLMSICLATVFSGVMARRLNDFDGERKVAYIVFLPPLLAFFHFGFLSEISGLLVAVVAIVLALRPGTFGTNCNGKKPNGPVKLKTLLFGL